MIFMIHLKGFRELIVISGGMNQHGWNNFHFSTVCGVYSCIKEFF